MPKWFTDQELDVLDALTATNPAIFVNFDGTPAGMKKGSKDEEKIETNASRGPGADRIGSEGSRGRSVVRQRAGSMAS